MKADRQENLCRQYKRTRKNQPADYIYFYYFYFAFAHPFAHPFTCLNRQLTNFADVVIVPPER
jgi:hypothetical protein